MTGSTQQTTLILGVGNPLRGDDAVGVLAIERLGNRQADLPSHVAIVDGGTAGLGLIPLFEDYHRVILVDAVPMNKPPGTIRRFEWQDTRILGHGQTLSLHESDLSDALILAHTLGCLPPEIVIYGVQPLHMDWDQPMSDAVSRALPALVDALINEVRSNKQHGR